MNETACAAALAAGTVGGEHAHRGLAAGLNGAGAVAVGANLRRSTRGAAAALTGGALLAALDGDRLFAAEGRLREADGDTGPDALTPLGGIGVAALAAEAAAEKAAEYIAQVAEVKAAAIGAAPGSRAVVGVYPGKTELIVAGLFLRVGQDLVGLIDILELLLGLLIAGVHVRVVLPGQLLICFFNFVFRSAFLNAQHLVIISFFSHTILLLTPQTGTGDPAPNLRFFGYLF